MVIRNNRVNVADVMKLNKKTWKNIFTLGDFHFDDLKSRIEKRKLSTDIAALEFLKVRKKKSMMK